MNGNSPLTCPTKRNAALPLRALREQVKRNVGVATEAAARLAATYALGDQLPDDIHAAVEHITQGVGVIGRNVVLLGGCHAKAASRQEEKLIDLDVRWQRALALRNGISEVRITAEKSFDDWPGETPLQIAFRAWFLQRQCREDPQPDRGIGHRAGKQGIGDMIGFAKAERQGKHDFGPNALDDRLGEMVGIVERRDLAPGGIHIDGFPETERKRKNRNEASIIAPARSIWGNTGAAISASLAIGQSDVCSYAIMQRSTAASSKGIALVARGRAINARLTAPRT